MGSTPACPRCGKGAIRSHDEWVCMTHGTLSVTESKPMAADIDELSAKDLEQMVRKRLETLSRHAQEAQKEIDSCRSEAAKLAGVLDSMGATVELPEALEAPRKAKRSKAAKVTCDICGGSFAGGQGLSTHKTRRHGKGRES